jgi:hypothetical protein
MKERPTVAAKYHPCTVLESRSTGNVAWHMSWRIEDPEAAVAKVIQRSLERAKAFPTTLQLVPSLYRMLRVEEATVPLQAGVFHVAWFASRSCTWAKVGCGIGKDIADRPRVVPVGVAILL